MIRVQFERQIQFSTRRFEFCLVMVKAPQFIMHLGIIRFEANPLEQNLFGCVAPTCDPQYVTEFSVVRQLARFVLDTLFKAMDTLLHPPTVTIQTTQ